jgi:hypothetical protein
VASRRFGRSVSGVIYCDRGWLPSYYGFCPSKKAWDREMRELFPHDKVHEEYPKADGHTATFERDGGQTILVTINEHMDKRAKLSVIGLLAHEAVHVMQRIMKDAGEKKPGVEIEAYAVQSIFQELLKAYCDTRRKIA